MSQEIIKKIKNKVITKDNDSLGNKTIKSSFWVLVISFSQRLLGLARNIIIARILAPDDLGLFGIALLTLSAIQNFTQTGFAQALIQKKDKPEKYLNTAWTIQLIRGAVLFAVLFVIAPYIAGFFNEPMASSLIRVLSLSMLTGGLTNIGTIFFRKDLRFHKSFILKITGSLADLIITIIALILMRNIWALVVGSMSGSIINLIVSYWIHSFRPRLEFNIKKARELFNFGKWIFSSGLLDYLLIEGDDIVLGRILGAGSLGLYQMAYRIACFPATQVTNLISRVSFPVYSKIQDQVTRLGNAYLKVLKITTFFSIPLSFFIYFFAYDFTTLVLGDKWLPAVIAMQGLAIWGLIRSIGATLGPVFQAKGRPDIGTKIQLAKLILLAIIIYPLTINYGMIGTVWAVVISALVIHPFADYILIRFIKISGWEFIKRLFYPMLGTGLTWLGLLFIQSQIVNSTNFLNFFGLIIAAGLIYLLIMVIFSKLGWYRVSIKSYFKKIWQ